MAKIVHTPEAIADLAHLWQFLSDAVPESAAAAVDDVAGALGVLAAHPMIGRRVDDELRELVISRGATGYVALYRFEEETETVRILRIRHQRESGFSD